LTLDGVDLRQIDRTFLHQMVALVEQQPLLLPSADLVIA
jgi:ABC-type multidrug transport system fused ATPase/permease subunit